MINLIQCPVCTLYLHMGMSLEQHLETHPKDQVIKALVSATVRDVHSVPSQPTHVNTQPSTGIVYGKLNVLKFIYFFKTVGT